MKVCRICLSKDGRLYPITSHGLISLYQQLTGGPLEVHIEMRLPQWLCAECGLRLMSYDRLRQKSQRSHQILCQLLVNSTYITEEDLNQIDRKKNNLESNLSYSLIDTSSSTVSNDGSDVTDLKLNSYLDEFLIDLGNGDRDTTADVKAEKESSNDCFSDRKNNFYIDNNISDTEDVDIASNSDNNLSVKEDFENASDSSDSVENLVQIRDKKFKLAVKKQVDRYLKLFKLSTNKKEKKNKVDKEIPISMNDIFAEESPIEIDNIFVETLPVEVEKEEVVNFETLPAQVETAKISPQYENTVFNRNFPRNTETLFDDDFIVQHLSLEEQKARLERKKFKQTYQEAPYKCNECYRGLFSETSYTRHRYFHSELRGKYQCEVCKLRFRDLSGFLRHTMSHKAIYQCRKCNFTSSNKPSAKAHTFKHKGKVYKCAQCNAQFTLNTSYLSHLRLSHVSKFVCEICGYSFVSAKGVNLHKKFKHVLEKGSIVSPDSPACATCNIRFVSDEALKTHKRVAHTTGRSKRNEDNGYPADIKSVICEICGLKTASSRQYRCHFRRYHPKEKPNLPVRRVKEHTTYICEHCGHVFKHKQNLMKHTVLHTGEKNFECDHCHKRFAVKQLVQSHIVNCHLPKTNHKPGEKISAPCSICGKTFANSNNRLRHLAIHSDQRPYSCEVCGSSFKTKGEVKAHTTHVHLKVPWPKKKARSTGQGAIGHH